MAKQVKRLRLIVFVFFILVFSWLAVFTRAGTDDNVWRWSWADNIGWSSFNNTSDGSSVDYGVKIDFDTGDLSGYAWSDNIGWISFNRSETGNPPSPPFNGGNGPIARYNFDTRELIGWGRVLANGGGWSGWLRFCDNSLPNCSSANQIARIDANGDWHGWAWSDMVVGWMSLNSIDPGAGGGPYKVSADVNRPPVILSADIALPDYEHGDTPDYIFFSWVYSDPDGDPQGGYEIKVIRLRDSQIRVYSQSGEAGSQSAGNMNHFWGEQFIWYDPSGLGYQWEVRAKDIAGKWSDWFRGPDFSTPLHAYPEADFSWTPQEPSANEDVQFLDQTTCYTVGGVSAPCVSWHWIFEDGNPAVSDEQNPLIQFLSHGSHDVTLKVTDNDGYSSYLTKSINVQFKLPGWKEVLPQ